MEPQLGTAEYSRQLVDRAKSLGVTGAGVDSLSAVVAPIAPKQTTPTPVPDTINAEKVQSNQGLMTIPQPTPSTLAEGITGKSAGLSDIYNAETQKALEAKKLVDKGDVAVQDSFERIEGIHSQRKGLEEQYNTTLLKETARKAANKMSVSQRAQLNELNTLERQNMSPQGKAEAIAAVNRKYAFEQGSYQLDFHLANSDYTAAQDTINDTIKLQLEPEMRKLDQIKYFADRYWDTYTKADQRAFDVKIKETENIVKSKENNLEQVYNIQLELAKLGKSVPSSIMSRFTDGTKTGADFLGELSKSGISLAKPVSASDSVPTVKSINGVDMQWNEASKKWENIGGTTVNDENTKAHLAFLRETAKGAADLSGASGKGMFDRIGGWLKGSTKYTQLEAYTNTLRTNVLTLMTDPGVKKYFGPQMSEADVRLMTAAGTTLNPENQSPAQLKSEVIRLDALLGRMQSAVDSGVSTTSKTPILAPTGERVIIID